MAPQSRKEELERRLEQSRHLLRGASDRMTSDRIGKLIGELEREQQIESERSDRPISTAFALCAEVSNIAHLFGQSVNVLSTVILRAKPPSEYWS
jgi:hypothetical protein